MTFTFYVLNNIVNVYRNIKPSIYYRVSKRFEYYLKLHNPFPGSEFNAYLFNGNELSVKLHETDQRRKVCNVRYANFCTTQIFHTDSDRHLIEIRLLLLRNEVKKNKICIMNSIEIISALS